MAESDGIPYALQHAHDELMGPIAEAIRQWNKNSNFSNAREVFSRVENFVVAFENSGIRGELDKRANLIAELCGPDSEYEKARQDALENLKSFEDPLEQLFGVRGFDSGMRDRHPFLLRTVLNAKVEIERILSLDNSRDALERWRKVCKKIENAANGLAVDGCYWLLQIHAAGEDYASENARSIRELRDAAATRTATLGFYLEDMRQAADSMVEFAIRKSRSDDESASAKPPTVTHAKPAIANADEDTRDDLLAKLESTTPPLSSDNGLWVRNKRAASLEGIETDTLKTYRYSGIKNADRTLGRDADGRVWRRQGTPRSHPWYLRSTLKCEQQQP
ncbi:MAG: hypothetical protein HYV60_19510 [Planctomycetia bacterium]|nr:hypothetical protein [Planctomycetia bacterium]